MCAESQYAPSQYLDSLVCGYPAKVRHGKLLVILTAHIDDSGNSDEGDNPARHFVLAGYVLPVEDWKVFSDRWAAELIHRPTLELFKMSDAEYGDGHFQGWPEEFRKLKVNELAQVIADFKPVPISAHLDWSEYNTIVKGNVHKKLDSPYAVLFYQIIKKSHEIQIKMNKQDPTIGFHRVDFVFDKQGKVGTRAAQWYDGLALTLPEPYKSMLGATPIFRDDVEIVALQAADMIAWHIHRRLDYPDEHRPVMDKIADMHDGAFLNAQTLRDFVTYCKWVDPKQLEESF